MWLIIILIIIGVLLMVAEIVLLPGMTIAGIGTFVAYGIAVYLGFTRYGTMGGILVIAAILILTIGSIIISLRAKTWQRFSLKNKVEGTSQPLPEDKINIGDHGTTVTRLAPIGKILIGEETYEAKAIGDIYVNERTEVEVVGFENFSIIVKVRN